MSKKVLIISTSPRKGSNSDALAEEFAKGAQEAGHEVEKISLIGKDVQFCRGCLACQKTKHCVIHDADIQIPTESEIPYALSESSETERSKFQPESMVQEHESEIGLEERESVKIQITVGDVALIATPEDNSSAEAFLALLQKQSITVQMSDYAGMEKVGPLETDLPRNDTQISVGVGDVILYQGNQITIYYGTNSWNFTKLAVIEGATKENLLEALGTGDVEVTFSLAQ